MGNTHRQAKKGLTPLQKGTGGGHREAANNQLPEFPLKRDDSGILPLESERGMSNISLTQEEMVTRSRGNVGLATSSNEILKQSSQYESIDTPYSPMRRPVNDHEENDSTNTVS
jgi:hypothetical protein